MTYATYVITFKLTKELDGLSNSEKATARPKHMRVAATNLQRAINQVVNALREEGLIDSKSDVVFLEGKVSA